MSKKDHEHDSPSPRPPAGPLPSGEGVSKTPPPAGEDARRAGEGADEVAAKEKLANDYFQQLLRLKADFENFRKRTDKEKPELIRFGRNEVLAKLLPLYDVMEQAHQEVQRRHATDGGDETVKSLAKGLELIFKEFDKLFASEGVTPIEAEGKRYDPAFHDVMGAVERADVEDGTVLDVLQPGFLLDGKVLRHAKVRISKKPAAPEAKTP